MEEPVLPSCTSWLCDLKLLYFFEPHFIHFLNGVHPGIHSRDKNE